jgi:hypothetical protein
VGLSLSRIRSIHELARPVRSDLTTNDMLTRVNSDSQTHSHSFGWGKCPNAGEDEGRKGDLYHVEEVQGVVIVEKASHTLPIVNSNV